MYFCIMIENKNQNNTKLSKLGEFGLIEHITSNFKIKNQSTVLGVGDDAAVLNFDNRYSIIHGLSMRLLEFLNANLP